MAKRDDGHPVLWGLTALVTVALVVGLLLGGAALVGTRVLGLDGASDSAADPAAADSLYLPSPSPTTQAPTASPSTSPTASSVPSRKPTPITLIAGQRRVGVFGRIDLSGSYPTGEGAVLEVQRLEGRSWASFYSVNTVVTAGRFATNVQTSRAGVNAFRVVDTGAGTASNPVRVRVG